MGRAAGTANHKSKSVQSPPSAASTAFARSAAGERKPQTAAFLTFQGGPWELATEKQHPISKAVVTNFKLLPRRSRAGTRRSVLPSVNYNNSRHLYAKQRGRSGLPSPGAPARRFSIANNCDANEYISQGEMWHEAIDAVRFCGLGGAHKRRPQWRERRSKIGARGLVRYRERRTITKWERPQTEGGNGQEGRGRRSVSTFLLRRSHFVNSPASTGNDPSPRAPISTCASRQLRPPLVRRRQVRKKRTRQWPSCTFPWADVFVRPHCSR